MIDPSVQRELLEQLQHMEAGEQQKVLAFARRLVVTRTVGAPGQHYLAFAGNIDRTDLDVMAQAIESGCEQVYAGDW